MTREEAISFLQVDKQYQDIKDYREALDIAIKALEQEPILDKIRAEIEQAYCKVENDYDRGRNYGLYMATQIIDNYKLESEE